MQEIHRALCMGCGPEDGALVVPQHFKPGADRGAVIIPHFGRDGEIRRQERRAQFGDQLFAGVAFITPTLAAEVAL